jgi:PAS domain S-box-containing protein
MKDQDSGHAPEERDTFEAVRARLEVAESARAKVEAELQAASQFHQSILESMPSGVGWVSVDGSIRYANPEAARILGMTRQELAAATPDVFLERTLHEDGSPCPLEDYPVVRCLSTGEPQPPLTVGLKQPDGSIRWAVFNAVPLCDPRSGQSIGAVVMFNDISQRKSAEAQLLGANAELERRVQLRTQELLRKNDELEREVLERRRAEIELQTNQRFLERMLNVHERERQLVAYEIHDTFVQDVIAALMYCESFAERTKNDPPEWPLFDQARLLLKRAIDEARRMISGLRPPIIDEQGIVAGIEYLASEFKQRGLDVEFVPQGAIPRMPSLLEGSVFRIAQEALNNTLRHSGVAAGRVDLGCEAQTLRLAIRDDGVGFDTTELPEGRFGLQGMRERARLVGGRLTMESAPGQGTCVRLEMPILPAEE